jgi:3-deoxy-D-manno-octulosonic-acid transferase
VVAGSVVPDIGGHNPLEAARLDCPAISGPFGENWASAYAGLEAIGGVVIATGDFSLLSWVALVALAAAMGISALARRMGPAHERP